MPTMTLKNPYKGINAHLHSIAQNPKDSTGIWTSIHANHIVDIVNSLNRHLPLNYVARAEQSLQIKEDDTGLTKRPQPDGSIYRTGISDSTIDSGQMSSSESILMIPMEDFETDDFYTSATIRRASDNEMHGKPITRIELLSPFNKVGGGGYEKYLANRRNAFFSGTSLIEIDYLHESVSPIARIPVYPHDDDSHPYTIAVTDIRFEHNPKRVVRVHIVDIDQVLPDGVKIPLADDDFLEFDFNAVYQETYTLGRWGTNIDYTELPRKFETYSPADQVRIKAVMERAKELSDAE